MAVEGIDKQISSLMILFFAGLVWSFLYDWMAFLFAKRRQLGDFCFWLFSLFLIFPVLLFTTYGELRVSWGVGLLVGVLCYRRLFHPGVSLFFRFVKRKLRRRQGFFT
ncbi:MAG TPA: spore cortex biosynthesis protein YabQ [Capillibacterium sp.]